jgi:hypothetical protein
MAVALSTMWMAAAAWPMAAHAGPAAGLRSGQTPRELQAPMKAPLRTPLRTTVRTYDAFGVTSNELRAAHATASAILRDADLEIAWRDCGAPLECGEPLGPGELVVRIVAAPARAVPRLLGYSLIDVEWKGGSLATILADRIEDLAGHARADSGLLMGRAIAHELGHLLLGTNAHPGGGLMRANWTAAEIEADRRGDWMLSRDEAARIREGLAARSRPSSIAAATVTSGGCVCPPPTSAKPPRVAAAVPGCFGS